METILKNLKTEALEKSQKIDSLEKLYALELEFLGKKGRLTEILKGIKDLSPEEKKVIGLLSNTIKKEIEENFAQKKLSLENEKLEKALKADFFDTTIPAPESKLGHIHPLAKLQKEVEDIFSSMGFSIMDGPEVESEHYNFNALNVPSDHPARDMQDTFFIKGKSSKDEGRLLMRTQTSPVQVRTMLKYGAPLRIIVPGRTFRNEATDAKHEMTFSQVEGLLVDKDISIATLKGIMTEALSAIMKNETEVRLRPGYFPFVEPGLELDFKCVFCHGKGCKTCKHEGWIEIAGTGMVHKNVLIAGGIDPKEYQGWAFGIGFERLAMMRYQIPDIRYFLSGDIRFTRQF
ncbi:MAG: phenylalanine--tRNA ligase subunit alpha [Candidatus Gracilibacteria bacterium]|jgi:phenylalanyl-tRNA synthetase alpha chain|nr:phenylalanine--tRNA ligase subunit alpha [Candidatus Gracilibacteria bacterium]